MRAIAIANQCDWPEKWAIRYKDCRLYLIGGCFVTDDPQYARVFNSNVDAESHASTDIYGTHLKDSLEVVDVVSEVAKFKGEKS